MTWFWKLNWSTHMLAFDFSGEEEGEVTARPGLFPNPGRMSEGTEQPLPHRLVTCPSLLLTQRAAALHLQLPIGVLSQQTLHSSMENRTP